MFEQLASTLNKATPNQLLRGHTYDVQCQLKEIVPLKEHMRTLDVRRHCQLDLLKNGLTVRLGKNKSRESKLETVSVDVLGRLTIFEVQVSNEIKQFTKFGHLFRVVRLKLLGICSRKISAQ